MQRMGQSLHTLGSGPKPGNLDLKEGINVGASSYKSDPDKWKAAGCPRCLQTAWRTGTGLWGLGSRRDWLRERAQDVLLTRGLQRKRDFSAAFHLVAIWKEGY